jgi:hypothetical protein
VRRRSQDLEADIVSPEVCTRIFYWMGVEEDGGKNLAALVN